MSSSCRLLKGASYGGSQTPGGMGMLAHECNFFSNVGIVCTCLMLLLVQSSAGMMVFGHLYDR